MGSRLVNLRAVDWQVVGWEPVDWRLEGLEPEVNPVRGGVAHWYQRLLEELCLWVVEQVCSEEKSLVQHYS